MGWSTRDRIVGLERTRTARMQHLPSDALRGPTTLEEHTLPAAIVACFAALALIQVILTW